MAQSEPIFFCDWTLEALNVALAEVNTKTDLKIKLASIERSKHRRVVAFNFAIKTQAIPKRLASH
jgi:hypothetical protein